MRTAGRGRGGSDLLSFLGIEPVAYRVISREAHIAEKLHAYSYPRPPTSVNARLKDLPDIALLATTSGLRAGRIRAAVQFTFSRRGSHAVPSVLGEPPVEWVARYLAMAADNRLPWPTLDDVLVAARAFVDPILASNDDAEWDPIGWVWRPVA
ncbi:MAG: nucleotidyl transferase AbiEii/AbiGii toxin family protein [Myxococcales bacterium]|nr:nucleotidyl transferase AbiEii/AbiGii toxin family protein [Myxococcales bacterium]